MGLMICVNQSSRLAGSLAPWETDNQLKVAGPREKTGSDNYTHKNLRNEICGLSAAAAGISI